MSLTGRARPGRPDSRIWMASLLAISSQHWARTHTVTSWSRTSCCADRATADLHQHLSRGRHASVA
jgi:hypothetical protein